MPKKEQSLKRERLTVSYPGELLPYVEQRVKEELYQSMAEYFEALMFFDLWCRRSHLTTGGPDGLMRQPKAIIYRVVREIIEDWDNPNKERGWFEEKLQLLRDAKTSAEAAEKLKELEEKDVMRRRRTKVREDQDNTGQ